MHVEVELLQKFESFGPFCGALNLHRTKTWWENGRDLSHYHRFLPIGASSLLLQNPLLPTPWRWYVAPHRTRPLSFLLDHHHLNPLLLSTLPHSTTHYTPPPPPSPSHTTPPLLPPLISSSPLASSARRVAGVDAATFLNRLLEDTASAFISQLWRALWHSSPSSWRLPLHPPYCC